jgi:hypothetical protein
LTSSLFTLVILYLNVVIFSQNKDMRVAQRGPLGNVNDNTRNILGGLLVKETRADPNRKTFPLVEIDETLYKKTLPPPITPLLPKLPPLTPMTPQLPRPALTPMIPRNICQLPPTPVLTPLIPSIRIQSNSNLIPGGKIIRRPKKYSTDEEWREAEREQRRRYNNNHKEKLGKQYQQYIDDTKLSMDKLENELILMNLRLDRAYEAIKRLERIINDK